ncbi:MAG: HDIG domain-containing protein [Verrucomicrobiota bacterium JB023]|nr:HDIG domain-containing protein [Verrucomicrobiota bacterium JB023]
MEFFDRIKRERLARRGLSSGKKRRRQDQGGLAETIEGSLWVRVVLYALCGVVAGLLVTQSPGASFEGRILPGFVVTTVILLAAILIFHFNHPVSSHRTSKVFLTFGGLLGQLLLVRGVLAMEPPGMLLLMPVAFVPIIHSVLLGQRIGTLSAVFSAILGAMVVRPELAMEYLGFALVAGYTGVLVTRKVRKRGQLLRAGFYVGLVGVVLALLLGEIDPTSIWRDGGAGWKYVAMQMGLVFGTGVLTGMVVSGLLPLLEGVFLLTTEISWLEMSDLNHKLLRRMQIEAPGTFHHSLMVAQLAETAAEAVGANSTMCRVCAYFHDIGKLRKPGYFVENQVEVNPHDDLTPTMSALVIIAHVKDGVDIAIKEKLAPEIIDVIQEHHGDSLVYYFYRKAREQHDAREADDKGAGADEELVEVDEKNFRYPGPRPQSKESGIISLADAVESASRSLEKPNPTKIRALVDEIVLSRIRDGQLDDCGLTMNDIRTIREVFAKTLRSMMHTRIAYPSEKKGKKSREGDTEAKNVVRVEELERRRKKAGGN